MKKRKKVLVIVAHPDDETVWMGGTLLKNDWNLTIISLCRRDDADRAPRFRKVCDIYKAKCYMSDLEDVHLNKIDKQEIIKRIKRFVKSDDKFDEIYTHGRNGEYNHIRHEEVHRAVLKMIKNGDLKCKRIFFFSYFKKGKFCYPKKESLKFIKLDSKTYLRKKYLIKEVYGFDKGGFEEICCRDSEAFNIKEIK